MSGERDPSRWIEPSSGVPASLRRALGAARGVAPSPRDVAELAARLPLPPGPGGGGASGPSGADASRGGGAATPPMAAAPSVIPGALAGAVLGLLAGGAWLALTSGATPTTTVATPAAPAHSETVASPPVAAPVQTSLFTPSAAGPKLPAAASASAAVTSTEPQETESELLQRARSKARSDPSAALALASEHGARFPRGALAQEREVIAITALVTAGRTAEARARAERFFSAFPGSPHLRRIDALFDGSGNDGAGKNSRPSPPPIP